VPVVQLQSAQSLYIEEYREGKRFACATAFIVASEARDYLVTNRHVVRGKDPDKDPARVPNSLRIMQNVRDDLGKWLPRFVELYDQDGRPLWYEHPETTPGPFDVAVVPLAPADEEIVYLPVDIWAEGDPTVPQASIAVANELSIIGFPFGYKGGGHFGIWVRGFVASEPELDWDDFPAFLIDSRTRDGQSGSPVMGYWPAGQPRNVLLPGNSAPVMQMTNMPITWFMGIYSGRLRDTAKGAETDLGLVWKTRVIREIIAAKQRAVVL